MMKKFGELKFEGMGLNQLFKDLKGYSKNGWKMLQVEDDWEKYIRFQYIGKKFKNAILFIFYLGNVNEVHVGNIIPTQKDNLSIDEYNELLINFYEEVILPIQNNYDDLCVKLDKGNFNPLQIMSKSALEKLELFCDNANKSTGSNHQSDQERWFDFIIQTVKDGKIIEYDTLKRFLMDKDYWGEKKEDFIGAIGEFAWSEEKAEELADEYSSNATFLHYYLSEGAFKK